ncbi:hypothetical protein M3Y97_00281400 [Aphelenchoides bicaudatus]|nr:hypothetical protein M3Y97_00281400 [Aphelenchoides bicaudatus]
MSRIDSTCRRNKVADDPNAFHEIHRVNSECTETPWKSVYIASIICFAVAAQMSMFFASIYPYLQILDSSVTETFFGYIIASYSLGQIIASPLIGYWSNRVKNIRFPLIICLLMSIFGNVTYILTPLISHSRKYSVLLSRFLVGVGAASIGLLRTYAATASTKEDRTRSIAFVTGGFALGMSSGPALQLAFVPISYPGLILFNKLTLSMYSAPAWSGLIASSLGILLVNCCFVEQYAGLVNKVEVTESGEIKKVKLPNYDQLAAVVCYCTRFAQMFTYTNLETIGAPLVMASYALTRAETVTYLAIAHSLMSGLAFCVYISFAVFKIDNVKFRSHLMCALFGLIVFHLLTFAYPFWPNITKTYTDQDVHDSINSTEPVGCNISRLNWCLNMTPPNMILYFVSFSIFIGICFPNINLTLGTMFSHIIGIMLMSGSLARINLVGHGF